MQIGKLTFKPVDENYDLVASAVRNGVETDDVSQLVFVAEIDPNFAACLILASDTADVNGAIRKQLNARKVSFAPKETALTLIAMEYGGVTPIGLSKDWPLLIDDAIMQHETVIAGRFLT